MIDTPKTFPYSVTCSVCGNVLQADAETPFAFMAGARVAGWEVPDILDNKPIKCPTHKTTA